MRVIDPAAARALHAQATREATAALRGGSGPAGTRALPVPGPRWPWQLVLIDEDTGLFLGATMMGIAADEIIHSISLVMACGGTWQSVREALPAHPTVTEFLPTIIDRRKALLARE